MQLNRRHFLKQLGAGAAGVSLLSAIPADLWAKSKVSLPRSLPEAQGVASAGLLDFLNGIEAAKLNVHSVMVLRHGKVVAEGWWAPYAPDLKHTLYSLSKSFTSTAVGLAVGEGKLTVEDKVVSFFPDELPATVSENLAAMRVKDLLTMTTGHSKEPSVRTGTETWAKGFLAQPVDHKPGTHFVYNSIATYMLSAIVQKLTGQTVLAYLKPRLFDPLGIEGADWEVDPKGINTGGWGLRLKTEDIAKFGQLYLQKGVWNGKRILAENWINDATRYEVQSAGGSRPKEQNDWLQGYGYQFWRCRHDAYRGDGAYGQYCIVLPKEDAVVAITSETGDMGAVMDNVWTHILPALRGEGPTNDSKAPASLKQKLASLALPMTPGQPTSPMAAQVSNKTYSIAENPLQVKTASLNFGKDNAVFRIQDAKGEHRIICGLNRWVQGETDLLPSALKLTATPIPGETKTKIAASGTWIDDNTFVITLRYIETAHYDTLTCQFKPDGMDIQFRKSLNILSASNKDTRPVLQGKQVV